MTSTPPGPPFDAGGQPPPAFQPDASNPAGPRVTAEQVRDLGRLRRTVANRKVAGVAGGIARHLDIDPLIIRVAFVVLTLFGGAGLIVYAACWILLPEDGQQNPPLGLDERSRSVALVLVGILGLALLVGQWDWFWVPGPLILVALVVWLVVSRRNEGAAPSAPVAPPTGVPGAGPDAVTPGQRWASAADAATATEAPASERPAAAQQQAYQQTYQHAYEQPGPPSYPTTYVPPAPRNPRKRGPKLFWFTMALAALAVGVVSIVDLAGAPVAGSTYPAVVLAVVGVMLLIGSFYGRAGGLILVGLLASVATGIGLAADKFDEERTFITPDSASEVLSRSYDFDAGEYTLDLTQVRDPEALDDQTVEMSADFGELVVIVPDDMDVTADARIDGPGGYTLFGQEHGGIDTDYTQAYDAGEGVPQLTLDLQLDVGHIEVRTEPFQEIR